MENFVIPNNMQGMLILVKWHEWKKGKRYFIPILYGNKIIIMMLGSVLPYFGIKSEQRVGGIIC